MDYDRQKVIFQKTDWGLQFGKRDKDPLVLSLESIGESVAGLRGIVASNIEYNQADFNPICEGFGYDSLEVVSDSIRQGDILNDNRLYLKIFFKVLDRPLCVFHSNGKVDTYFDVTDKAGPTIFLYKDTVGYALLTLQKGQDDKSMRSEIAAFANEMEDQFYGFPNGYFTNENNRLTHVIRLVEEVQSAPRLPRRKTQLKSKRTCHFFNGKPGSCRQGNDCKFSHALADRQLRSRSFTQAK